MQTLKYITIGALILAAAIGYNVYLSTGCYAGSGVMTWHGKVCAITSSKQK